MTPKEHQDRPVSPLPSDSDTAPDPAPEPKPTKKPRRQYTEAERKAHEESLAKARAARAANRVNSVKWPIKNRQRCKELYEQDVEKRADEKVKELAEKFAMEKQEREEFERWKQFKAKADAYVPPPPPEPAMPPEPATQKTKPKSKPKAKPKSQQCAKSSKQAPLSSTDPFESFINQFLS